MNARRRVRASARRKDVNRARFASLDVFPVSGTLIVARRSTSAKPSYDFNELLPLLESVLELVRLRVISAAHFGKQLHRAELVRKFNLATLRVVGLRQSVIGN